MTTFLIQLGLIWLGASGLGSAARRLRMPAIVGEIFAGVLLGPTVFGALQPSWFQAVFVQDQTAVGWRHLCAKAGLLLFLFLAGTEGTVGLLKQRHRAALWVSLFGMLIPFGLGAAAVLWQPAWWARYSDLQSLQFALLVGAALSISALPVIARIFMDLGLMDTTAAGIVMVAATCDDLVGWLVFSGLVFSYRSDMPLGEFLPFLMFWAGVLAAKRLRGHQAFRQFLSVCTMRVFAPVYFVSIGLKTNFLAQSDALLIGGMLVIAFIGKITGALLGAWVSRMAWREAYVVAFAMNARGAMGILLATMALETRLIAEPLFVALVVMALVTSIAAGPMIRAVSTGHQA